MNKHVRTKKVMETSVCNLGLILYENVGLQMAVKQIRQKNKDRKLI